MNYIRAITWSLFYYVIFDLTFGNILNLLQHAANIIHKYVGRIFVIYKAYLMCVMFSLFTELCAIKGINSVGLLIFITIFLFIYAMGSFNATKNNDAVYGGRNSDFAALVGVSSIIAVWFIYYFKLYILHEPAKWFMYIMSFIPEIPVLGNIITFLINYALIILILLFSCKRIFTKLKNQNAEDLSQE